MSLDLNPTTESRIQEYAEREGIDANTFINGLLDKPVPRLRRAPRLRVLPLEEAKRLNIPLIEHLQAQLDEAAQATPEEIAQAEIEWQSFKKQMNDTRRANGESPVYKEDERS